MNPILKVTGLRVEKGSHVILENVGFEVEKGDSLAIIGPNGAGKTTLFKALLGLIPYQGTIEWEKGVKISYVPQRFYVEDDIPLTASEFFALKEGDSKKIAEALEAVGLERVPDLKSHILNNKLGQLSGGELQRILVAWSLLGEPDVLLFDEPTAGVDFVGEETVYSMLEKLKRKRNLTILLISHELDIVRKFTNKVLCLNKENICFGPPLKVMNKDTIDRLFGEEMSFYEHRHI